MNLFKCTILSLLRQPKKTLILLLVFYITLVGELSSLVLLYSANRAQDTLLLQIGGSVTLDYSVDYILNYNIDVMQPAFTQETADKVLTVEHVVGCNQKCSGYVMPTNFTNCKYYEGIDPSTQTDYVQLGEDCGEYVVLEGDSGLEWIDLFRLENAVLKEGRFPSDEEPGVIISEQLAEVNGLSVGDTLTVTDAERDTGNTASIEVVGIFETSATFTVTMDNLEGKNIFRYSPYNRMYADLNTVTSFFEEDREALYFTFYVDSPDNVQAAAEAILALDLDWDKFELSDSTDSDSTSAASQITSTVLLAKVMLVMISAISIIAILLVTSVWAEHSRYEGGIYLALGASRWCALFQQGFSSLVLLLPALQLAIRSAKPLANALMHNAQAVTGGNSSSGAPWVTGIERATSVSIIEPSGTYYLLFALCAVVIGAVACILPTYSIIRLKPREILAKQ